MSIERQHNAGAPAWRERIAAFFPMWSAWLVLAVALTLTFIAWHIEHKDEHRVGKIAFDAQVQDIELRIRQRMLAYEQVLQGAAGLFAASRSVERDEWRTYIKRLAVEQYYPGILGVGYSAHLLPAEKERQTRQIRREGFPDFYIFPQGERTEYTSVIYVEPFTGRNLLAFGYDMFADPVRRAAMERARDSGQAAISGKIALFHMLGENTQAGVLLYLPIYRNGWPLASVAQRRAALQGYVFAPFSMDELMVGILGSEHAGLEIELYDGAQTAPAAMLYDSAPQHLQAPHFSSSTGLNIAGQRWGLTVKSPSFSAAGIVEHFYPSMILLFGVAVSLLLFALIRNLAQSQARATTLAKRMSAECIESQQHYRQLFEEAPIAIALADAESGEILDLNRAMEQLAGWDKADLIGQSQKMLHPPELAQNSVVSGCFARRSGDMEGKRLETQLLTKSGATLEVAIKASSLNLHGRRALIGFFADITGRKQQEQNLFKSNELLERILANISTLIAYMDTDFNFIRVNHAYAAADGHSAEYFVGKNHFALFPNAENEEIFRKVVASGLSYSVYAKPFVYEHNQERGVTYWDWNVQPVKDQQGKVCGLLLNLLDRTDEKRAEEKLRLYGRALEASVNSVAIVDASRPQLPLVYVNRAYTSITGYSEQEALGRNPSFLQGGDRDQPEIENIRAAVRDKRDGHAILRNYRKDGSLFWNELYVSPVWSDSGEVTHFIGVARDITQRKNYEEELERMSSFDTLTGLANRNLFLDRLSQAIVHAHRNAGFMAVAVLDLDDFKLVNDSFGHPIGDMLLHEVAQRLAACVREGDTVARLGGDEFAVLMPSMTKAEDAVIVAGKLLRTFAASLRCELREIFVTASIGIALYPKDGQDAETLLKFADQAMYRAKAQGRNQYQFYAAEMNLHVAQCMQLGHDLHRALESGEFRLHYQPQVDLRSGLIVGVEALLRWQHPVSGPISPATFIPVAEECGMIVPIGNWVLRQACLAAKGWHEQGFEIVVAVNLSARQLREPGLVETVRDALDAAGLKPRFLELELTESILIEQADFVFNVLRQLREMGVELALDDFGTGYSSLSYLKRFPIGRLKIDQSFVRDIVSDPEDAAIVGAIISMAHDLKLKAIAEGVETREQLAFLRQRHCDEMQGYYFSKPVPPEEIAAILQQGKHVEPDCLGDGQAPAVLLVDDEENILNSLVRLLRRDGYRILRTTSAQEALGMLACNKVAVIVTDQRMAEMDGVEFLRRAKQLHPDSMRMVLSGYMDLQSVTDAINEGAVYKFLTKPWDDEQLRGHIREAFQRYELKQENDSLIMQLASANAVLSRAKQLLERQISEGLPQADLSANQPDNVKA